MGNPLTHSSGCAKLAYAKGELLATSPYPSDVQNAECAQNKRIVNDLRLAKIECWGGVSPDPADIKPALLVSSRDEVRESLFVDRRSGNRWVTEEYPLAPPTYPELGSGRCYIEDLRILARNSAQSLPIFLSKYHDELRATDSGNSKGNLRVDEGKFKLIQGELRDAIGPLKGENFKILSSLENDSKRLTLTIRKPDGEGGRPGSILAIISEAPGGVKVELPADYDRLCKGEVRRCNAP